MFKRKNREVVSLQVIGDLCIGCGRCVNRCRHDAIGMKYKDDRGRAVAYHPERCVGCGKCIGVCPTIAIELIAV